MTRFELNNKFALRKTVVVLSSTLVWGCANFSPLPENNFPEARPVNSTANYTLINGDDVAKQDIKNGSYVQFKADVMKSAPLLKAGTNTDRVNETKIKLASAPVSLNADAIPLNSFINLALGEVLHLDYIVDAELAKKTTPITLRVNNPVDSKRLLGLVEEVLLVNKVALVIDDGLIKVIPAKKTGDAVPELFNKSVDPLLKYGKVAEIIPVYYLPLSEASSLVNKFLSERQGGQVLRQSNLNSLMVIADRNDIKRVYTLLAEIDVPSRVASNMTLISPQYVSQENLINDLMVSLSAASVPVSLNKGINGVVLIPLSNNSVLVTTSTKSWLDYTLQWVKKLDKPQKIEGNKGIYVYNMQNAKAEDAWSVVQALFKETQTSQKTETQTSDLVAAAQGAYKADKSGSGESSSSYMVPGNQSYQPTKINKPNSGDMQVVTDSYRVIVDSKQNSIFFTGEYQDYQRLLELLTYVDKRPKQVLLHATIAEVTNSDGYSLGFNFSTDGADGSGSTTMSLANGGNLTMSGLFGDFSAEFNAALSNGKAQVLQSPRLIVLDQESASIDIGSRIQVTTGSTTNTDSETTTKTYSYISTGVTLNITPTINDNGLVELDISQVVSSVGATRGDSPDINNRSLQTVLLANSGDTVFMGGIISNSSNKTENKVPFFGDLPIIGKLFSHESEGQDSTELVLLITPYVINSRDDALFYTREFQQLTGWTLPEYK